MTTTTIEAAQRIAGSLTVEINHDGSRVWIHSSCGTRIALCSALTIHWGWTMCNGPEAGDDKVHDGNGSMGGGRGFKNDPEGCMADAVAALLRGDRD